MLFGSYLCGEFFLFAFQAPVSVFSFEVLKGSPPFPLMREFLSVWILFLLHNYLPGTQVPILKSFVSFFPSLSFALLHSEELAWAFWKSAEIMDNVKGRKGQNNSKRKANKDEAGHTGQ